MAGGRRGDRGGRGAARAVAYIRRHTRRQALSQAGQLRAIRAEATRRGWKLVAVYRDTASGKSRQGRVGLASALAVCRDGDADALVVAKLDRLARSTVDFGAILAEVDAGRYGLVVLDHQIDTTTANGRLVANILMSVAQWEREIISERTRDALATVEDPRRISEATRATVCERLVGGDSQRAVARDLGLHRATVAGIMRDARRQRTKEMLT